MPLVFGPGVLQCHRGSELPPSPSREKGEQGAMEPQALPGWPGWAPNPGDVPGSTAPMWGDALVALEAEELDPGENLEPGESGSPGQMEDTPSGGEEAVSPKANSLLSATQLPESPGSNRRRLQCWDPEDSLQNWLDSGCGVRPNMELLRALGEMQRRCAILKEENQQLRKSSFPETEEKVRRLKRKNAELAVIAKRLEERAHKLQEANLLMVNAPMPRPGAGLELARKALAGQRARDLSETASALLAKDKQIAHLQRQCQELQARLSSEGKEGPQWLNVWDFDRLLRESQQEVLRLQRQIALRNLQEVPLTGSPSPLDTTVLPPAPGAPGEAVPLARLQDDVDILPEGVSLAEPESQQRVKQLELELGKKRKKWETLEHEVRKKQRRCEELELQLRKAQSENARLVEENSRLSGRASGKEEVESENAELRGQLQGVTEERDSALRRSQGLQSKLESLEQVLKHMREVAQRRQQLELEHEQARIGLQEKQEEVLRLQQAQAQAKREHEGAVQLLESTLDSMQARVRELEEQCRSQTERFSLLAQELQAFRMHPGPLDLLSSTLGTSSAELPPAPCCCSTPQPCRGPSPKDVDVLPASPRHGAPRAPDVVSVAHSGAPRRTSKKAESLSNSSRSESIHNSPKSCPTPEVDTASEVEELETDSVSLLPETEGVFRGSKLQVFLARYSYNPFEGPNENPEAELPLTAGEYIYIYGHMDEDGFFEGELMDGRRGLVPSNFVERVSDDDLVTSLPPELMDLSHSSGPELSFLSGGGAVSSGGQSSGGGSQARHEEERNELSPSPLLDPPAVPYPRHLAVLKQLAHSVVLTWEPPLDGAEVQGYHVCVDGKLHQALGPGTPRKAVLEHLDLQSGSCCVSVQAVTSQGSSDPLRCCVMVGAGAGPAPSQLRVHRLTATSAEITWVPSNSNLAHAVYLNGEECPPARPGTYWGTFCHLRPGTPYQARVEARPFTLGPLEPSWEKPQNRAAVVHFTTLAAGPPDAPLDVQIEQGPSPGILVISWLPVTIDAAGSSNGVRVTGYAVYADGQKIMEVASPTAGSVLVDLSQLQLLRVCREVVVRTMSPHGESVDSVPAQLPPALALAYPPPPVLRPSATSLLPSTSPEVKSPPCPASLGCGDSSPLPQHGDPPGSQDIAGDVPSSPSKAEERLSQEDSTWDSQQEAARALTAAAWAAGGKRDQDTGPPLSGKKEEEAAAVVAEKESGLAPCPAPGAPAERMLGVETGRGELGPGLRTRAEQREDATEVGARLTNSLMDHGRSSDLSDIQEEEEEEEEEPGTESLSPPQHGETNNRESGAKLDSCETDSDEEILEQILELPLQQFCSKKLFSIPEEEEDEVEEEKEEKEEEKKGPGGSLTYAHLPEPQGVGLNRSGSRLWELRPSPLTPDSSPGRDPVEELTPCQPGGSPLGSRRRGGGSPEKLPARKRPPDLREHCSRLLGSSGTQGSGRSGPSWDRGAPSGSEGMKCGTETSGKGWPGPSRRCPRGLMPESGLASCFAPKCLEISIEYDSEDEQESVGSGSSISSSSCCLRDGEGRGTGPEGAPLGGRRGAPGASPAPSHCLRLSSCEKGELERKGRSLNCRLKEPSPRIPEARELRGQDAAGQRAPPRKGSRPPRLGAAELGFPRNQAKEISPPNEPVRIFVALFDYDPVSMSPNPDAVEEELPFREGQLLKVCGEKDADGFYRGECGGRVGYVPCNMVAEVAVGSPVVKRQLLQRGYIHPDNPNEGLGNGSFPLLAPHPAGPPPKPRRSKKASSSQPDARASPSTPRSMVAAFDYNPRENSPNVDVEAELSFKAGDVITVFGAMDDDGFYYGELNGQRGLVPSNFLEGIVSGEDRRVAGPPKEKDAGVLTAESQLQSATAQDLTGPLPYPHSLRPGSTLKAKSGEPLAPAKKMRGLISKGKHLLRKLGSGTKE
ncbi:peripheral-type benzodiazepine receptor-associated protein 1 [Trichosurus vulpecula]|uniref:peripheral-type benzodiazepine receptor-associated protein 1 n=1 Tax=Trichosurus vulpecula TaxID=9337 RepID=UPI00186AD6C9|nr:peripheral-type benzodiazepine receptor-associated protein 1 [Trichosurus vulpecula]